MRMLWLDLFRCVAAVVVVAFHYARPLGLPRLEFGLLAVDLFFVLSGIVLERRYAVAIRDGMSPGEFAWHRVRRLYPMVALAILLIVGMNAADLPDLHPGRSGVGPLLAFAFVLPWFPTPDLGTAFPADYPAWSLFAELATNALWFVALRLGRRVELAFFVLAAIAFAWFAWTCGHGFDMGVGPHPLDVVMGVARSAAWFGVGVAISRRAPRPSLPWWLAGPLLVAACVICQRHLLPILAADFAVVASGTLLLIALAQAAPPPAPLRALCRWAGCFSFPLYMIHAPTARLVNWLNGRWFDEFDTVIVVVLATALIATLLNELIVARLSR